MCEDKKKNVLYSRIYNDDILKWNLKEEHEKILLKNFNIENEEYKPTEKNIKSELIDYDKIDEIISDLKSIDLEEVYEKYRDIPKEIIDKINITINKMKQVNNLLRRPIIIPGKTEWKNKKWDKEFIPNYEEIESIENVFLKLEWYIKNLKEKIKIQDQLID